jgi:hypothetical protein
MVSTVAGKLSEVQSLQSLTIVPAAAQKTVSVAITPGRRRFRKGRRRIPEVPEPTIRPAEAPWHPPGKREDIM